MKKYIRYRLRFVNAVNYICAIEIEIQNSCFTVIASDSSDIKPVQVERIILNSGERFDAIVTAKGGDFWMRVKGFGLCELFQEQYALITSRSLEHTLPDISKMPSIKSALNARSRVRKYLSQDIIRS